MVLDETIQINVMLMDTNTNIVFIKMVYGIRQKIRQYGLQYLTHI